ncbi:hypothetical protein LJC32_00070 [Oscillospiraceae bacterium OttesenSCG-928-F05]|nr:hypothetical protein [Oscillospiraceae bacterium OttesenSCG-928-F05]
MDHRNWDTEAAKELFPSGDRQHSALHRDRAGKKSPEKTEGASENAGDRATRESPQKQ